MYIWCGSPTKHEIQHMINTVDIDMHWKKVFK